MYEHRKLLGRLRLPGELPSMLIFRISSPPEPLPSSIKPSGVRYTVTPLMIVNHFHLMSYRKTVHTAWSLTIHKYSNFFAFKPYTTISHVSQVNNMGDESLVRFLFVLQNTVTQCR